MLRHALHQTADIIRLLGVRNLSVDGVLSRQCGKSLRRQPAVQQLIHWQVGKAQFIG